MVIERTMKDSGELSPPRALLTVGFKVLFARTDLM